jgi:hypothetical protein
VPSDNLERPPHETTHQPSARACRTRRLQWRRWRRRCAIDHDVEHLARLDIDNDIIDIEHHDVHWRSDDHRHVVNGYLVVGANQRLDVRPRAER